MGVLQIITTDPLDDLVDARAFLDAVIRRRQGERIDENVRTGIVGTPLNLKRGAPENKLAHLVEESKQVEMPLAPSEAEVEQKISDAQASVNQIAEEAIAKAADAPKRGRKPKPEVVKTVTADEVRAVMVELGSKGVEEQTRQKGILTAMGFEKLSQVPPERLVELLTKIKGE
jgi:hypothetical protein